MEDIEMKTITYNTETHVLVPREPSEDHLNSIAKRDRHDFGFLTEQQQSNLRSFAKQIYEESIGLGFFKLPQPEPVESEPVAWWNGKETAFFEHEVDGPVGEVCIPLYTTPQPDRTAELEAALKVVSALLHEYKMGNTYKNKFVEEALAKINEVLKP